MSSFEDAIASAADSVISAIYAAWKRDDCARIVLSGGRSGAALAGAIEAGLFAKTTNVLHLWFADERFVEYEDSERNDTVIINALADVGCALVIHRYATPSESNLPGAASSYARDLSFVMGAAQFDAVVLSVGEDGHVASIFPDRPIVNGNVFAISDSPKPPSCRISLSLSRLAKTRKCVVLALGESKTAVVERLIAGDAVLPVTALSKLTDVSLITDHKVGNDHVSEHH